MHRCFTLMPGVMPLSTDQRTVASDLEEFATDVNLSDDQKNKLRGILERQKKKQKVQTYAKRVSELRQNASWLRTGSSTNEGVTGERSEQLPPSTRAGVRPVRHGRAAGGIKSLGVLEFRWHR